MRSMRSSRSLALPLLLLLAVADLSSANPLPRDDDLRAMGYQFLVARGCPEAQQCGYNKYCCGSGEVCTTVSGDKATCVAAAACAGCATTWTETHTYTSTMATCWDTPPEPTVGVDCIPQADDQEACGAICCAGWQTCAYNGQCSAKPGIGEGTTIVVTSNGVVTTQYSAPYRVTGTTTVVGTGARTTETATTATAIGASQTSDVAVGGGGTGGDLSPGAIAGIVIGTLAGISLLLLLCFCCIARGLWMAVFGKKKKDDDSDRRERIDVYEERYSRHGSRAPSAHSRRDRHKGWFAGGAKGSGPSSAGDRREKKKSGSGKTWLGIAGLAATLLALLNLKKDKRPASKPARSSRYSDSYYSYSDYTSPSKLTTH